MFSISQVLVGSAPLKPYGFDKGCKQQLYRCQFSLAIYFSARVTSLLLLLLLLIKPTCVIFGANKNQMLLIFHNVIISVSAVSMYVCMFTAFIKPEGFQGRGTNWCLTNTNQKRAAKNKNTSNYINTQRPI